MLDVTRHSEAPGRQSGGCQSHEEPFISMPIAVSCAARHLGFAEHIAKNEMDS